jgi:hypothetical protein
MMTELLTTITKTRGYSGNSKSVIKREIKLLQLYFVITLYQYNGMVFLFVFIDMIIGILSFVEIVYKRHLFCQPIDPTLDKTVHSIFFHDVAISTIPKKFQTFQKNSQKVWKNSIFDAESESAIKNRNNGQII